MKKWMMSLVILVGLFGFAPKGHAQVEYVRVCSLYGAGFHYIPGTDICLNDETGDARVQTPGGTWRSILPYPEGKWVPKLDPDCDPGKLVHVGTFRSTDFTLNSFNKGETNPFRLRLGYDEFISKVIMSGGFYDPRTREKRAGNNMQFDGLCLRSKDPGVMEIDGTSLINPPYGPVPIGCISNSRIAGMPAAYSISSTGAYPNIDQYHYDAAQDVAGPYLYGSELVVTTDFQNNSPTGALMYRDASGSYQPMAGRLSVFVCVEKGSNDRDNNR